MAERLTREQRKAETRDRLLEAAGAVFARRGYHAASVEDVAEEAGFTKGAVYSNFQSKEDLFFALLDRHIEARIERVRVAVSEMHGPQEQARDAASDFMAFLQQERDWVLLFIEFWAYAVRDPALRDRFAQRWSRFRAEAATMISHRARVLGIDLAYPAELIAAAAFAMSNGIALEKLADPASVPDELYGFMLAQLASAVIGKA